MPSRRSKLRWIWLLILAVVAYAAYKYWPKGGLFPPAQTESPGGKKGGRRGGFGGPTPVVVTRATRGNIGVYFNGLGSVTPIYTTTIQSRVVGELMNVYYKEGDMVKKGDLLMEIDPRPYQVALEQAEGQLARDEAALNNARVDQARYEGLLKQNAIPEQQLATQIATVKQDEGIVKADQGQVDSAKLNLVYCHITAPITGRMGLRLVDPGNIVQTTTNLVVITQIEPISVIFTLAEDQLQPVMQRMRAGEKLRVEAWTRDNSRRIASGTLTTIDNQIDQTTGTVRLRATFDNKNDELFPNQFVNIRLLVQEKRGVTLLNSAAIQRSSSETYVFLVKPDSTVTVRDITVGTVEGEQSEITSGLQPGDEVVLTGVDKLQEGSKVSASLEGQQGGGRKGPPGTGASAGRGGRSGGAKQ